MNWHWSSCSTRCFGDLHRGKDKFKKQRPQPHFGGGKEGKDQGVTTVQQSSEARTVQNTGKTASDSGKAESEPEEGCAGLA